MPRLSPATHADGFHGLHGVSMGVAGRRNLSVGG